MYDVIIIGAGAAGLSAAIYTARRKLNSLVISIDKGGQTILASKMENYPGFLVDNGASLMKVFEKQVKDLGVNIVLGRVSNIEKINNNFKVKLSNNEIYQSKSVILAYGKVPAQLNIQGEDGNADEIFHAEQQPQHDLRQHADHHEKQAHDDRVLDLAQLLVHPVL